MTAYESTDVPTPVLDRALKRIIVDSATDSATATSNFCSAARLSVASGDK